MPEIACGPSDHGRGTPGRRRSAGRRLGADALEVEGPVGFLCGGSYPVADLLMRLNIGPKQLGRGPVIFVQLIHSVIV